MPPAAPATRLFCVVTIAWTWLLQWPAALLGAGDGPLAALAGLGIFGPAVGAMVAVRAEGVGAAALWKGLFAPGRIGWVVVALLLPPVVLAASTGIYLALGGTGADLVYLPDAPPRWAALVVMPLVEEVGWRAYALPRLQARHGPVKATLVVGVLWAAWHLPMIGMGGGGAVVMLAAPVMLIASSFAFTWVVNKSGGLLAAVAMHMGAHLSNPNLALPGTGTPLLLYTAGFVVLAAALLVVDRRAWVSASLPLDEASGFVAASARTR